MTNELTAERLRELVARATPGPWMRSLNPKKWVSTLAPITTEEWRANSDDDAAIIIALVNAAPQIIALIKREAQMREALVQISEIDTFTEPVSAQIARAALQQGDR